MTVYPYEPPEREYADTLMAFKDFQMASTWSVRVENDPLGPVNKIVSLMCGSRRIKSVLSRVPEGATVRLERDEGGWTLPEVFDLRGATWRTNEFGQRTATVHRKPHSPGWRVEINDRTVLAVTDVEIHLRTPFPPQRRAKPSLAGLRRALQRKARSAVDGVAGRLGYHREDNGGGDW